MILEASSFVIFEILSFYWTKSFSREWNSFERSFSRNTNEVFSDWSNISVGGSSLVEEVFYSFTTKEVEAQRFFLQRTRETLLRRRIFLSVGLGRYSMVRGKIPSFH